MRRGLFDGCFRRKKKRSGSDKPQAKGNDAKRSRVESSSGEGATASGDRALAKKWQKPHDREILLAVKRSGACDQTFSDLSKAFLFSGVFTEKEIRKRYLFLLEMLEKNRGAARRAR